MCLEVEHILLFYNGLNTGHRHEDLFPAFISPAVSVACCNTAPDNYLSVRVQRVDLEEAE